MTKDKPTPPPKCCFCYYPETECVCFSFGIVPGIVHALLWIGIFAIGSVSRYNDWVKYYATLKCEQCDGKGLVLDINGEPSDCRCQ